MREIDLLIDKPKQLRRAQQCHLVDAPSRFIGWFSSLSLALFLIVTISIAQAAFAQTKVPLLSGENRNEKGELTPIPERFTKIFAAIEKDLSIQFQLQLYPWNRAVKIASTEGGLIFGLSLTPEREAIFDFSEPALYQYLWLVTPADRQFEFNSIQDLKGKTIGVVRGSKYGGEFDQQRNILFKTDDDIDAYGPRLKKLSNRQVDAIIFSSALTNPRDVEELIHKIKIPNETDEQSNQRARFVVLANPVLKDGIRFAILRGQNPKLIQQINRSLKKMVAIDKKIKNNTK
ncbi:transporter substrate-binding domain-containing protein [Undibacterium seohonense]|uniref:Transporter substrate-binding domain-containing protein n=1 Tax=Undibacterium seohonense TaxID=1344950 RepID=A0ABR6X555_9BURK|nr:transporter substrate-binding domain-containing protein [Undibacterium seohonense]MBC3808037.1 transporter substrate-binding domain-containing protein [Undibacterium seohonense]